MEENCVWIITGCNPKENRHYLYQFTGTEHEAVKRLITLIEADSLYMNQYHENILMETTGAAEELKNDFYGEFHGYNRYRDSRTDFMLKELDLIDDAPTNEMEFVK